MIPNQDEIKPWAEGPLEILKHGIDHSKLDTDFDARIAMISIDNAVELMIKTYLSLPNRITGIKLSRRKFEEISDNFTLLLDKFEELAPDKILGIELGDLEWYHRLRNQLYHQGNGITVEKRKLEAYTELAKILFLNLYKVPIKDEIIKKPVSLVGEFINNYGILEKNLKLIMDQKKLKRKYYSVMQTMKILVDEGVFSEKLTQELIIINNFRNELIHGIKTPTEQDLKKYNNLLKANLANIKKQKDRNAYRYMLKKGNEIIYIGITDDPRRRESEHKREGIKFVKMEIVGPAVTRESAFKWESESIEKYKKGHSGKSPKYND